jgi:hypothetical protein
MSFSLIIVWFFIIIPAIIIANIIVIRDRNKFFREINDMAKNSQISDNSKN